MRFILTRFFAVSALVCGAAQCAYAAPIAAPVSDTSVAPTVLSSGVDIAAAIIQELPVIPRAPEADLELRDPNPEATPESPPDGEIQDVEGRTCFTIAICR